ncbi:LAME_0A07228g1_1 [Lachancea meyersii CBS 8951]|uniref:LAME_0A07228g1_1 n=1 Tax=Lachancea meyersii CBS 8951 TaxID=1266667 RepID=A0A1G4IR57_9SACH|nr:LAME_0A07228g1_1 [Lachancea meyersii CBS 8951]
MFEDILTRPMRAFLKAGSSIVPLLRHRFSGRSLRTKLGSLESFSDAGLRFSSGQNPYLKKVSFRKPKSFTMSSEVPEEPSNGISKPIVWIDCEMTGLDHTKDKIIEICCIITDENLNMVDEAGYESVVHCDRIILDGMDEWCVEHHSSSGLTQKVLESTKTTQQVEDELLAYVQKWIPTARRGVLAGNTVHMDRLFMLREFPKVVNHLFYRIIDVSTIMEVSFRHNPELASVFPRKKGAHTAKSDILESIAQLKWYREHYLKDSEETRDFVAQRKAEIEKQTQQETSDRDASSKTGVGAVVAAVKESFHETLNALKKESEDSNDEESPVKKQKLD